MENNIDLNMFAKRFSELLSNSDETTYTVAKKLGLSPATISRYANALMKPKVPTVKLIANIFNVNYSWLMGESDIKYSNSIFSIPGIMPVPKTVKKPRLGTIACGEPILAEENLDGYDEVPTEIKCDFTLLCKGDSMINARINDGDVVYIKQQPTVDNGEIAAVLIENEATLKRFYSYENKVVLQPENPQYSPLIYVDEEINNIRIIGKAVGFTSRL